MLGLAGERFFFLSKQEKAIDSKITTLLKSPTLEINRKDQKLYVTNPEGVLFALKKKNKFVKDEVSTILSSTHINALKPLADLSKTINSNPKVNLEKFTSSAQNVSATFSSTDPNELEVMKVKLQGSGLPDLKIDYTSGKNELNIDFIDRE